MKIDYQARYQVLREKLQDSYYEYQPSFDDVFSWVDRFIQSDDVSDLEKEFYLLLNQYPGSREPYIVVPHERVLIENRADVNPPPFIEYEIDFAVYGGIIDKPTKIALECDGLRSHKHKHSEKDRRKEVNLQLSNWIVIRLPGHEIHREIEKWEKEDNFVSDLMTNIEHIIKNSLRLIDYHKYTIDEIRHRLTGYTWGSSQCPHCNDYERVILNHKTVHCKKCGKKYLRDRSNDPPSSWEFEGMIYFDSYGL